MKAVESMWQSPRCRVSGFLFWLSIVTCDTHTAHARRTRASHSKLLLEIVLLKVVLMYIQYLIGPDNPYIIILQVVYVYNYSKGEVDG